MVEQGTVTEYLDALRASRRFGPQVVCSRSLPATPGQSGPMPSGLHPRLVELLHRRGIEQLYRHQSEAVEAVLAGEDLLVATPTASGKSLIYNLPVLNTLFAAEPASALYLFPLKALARDQQKTVEGMYQELGESGEFSAVFDGDTSPYRRRRIRQNPPPAVLTNPEMLHLSLLPWHSSWSAFLTRLKYVIIDEVHSCRGISGSHIAWVVRRLQRIAAEYGANPQFILLSATIGNPAELGEQLLGRKVRVIEGSGAPQAAKKFLFVNPWESAASTACQFLQAAVERELRTVVYTRSRRMTELISSWTAQRLKEKGRFISAYRAGYLPEERREIEGRLFSGELLGVISTSALELGIDIGSLDLCLLVGYPGSVMATWQRAGRVGRSGRPSAIILLAGEDALDQHFMRDPKDFFNRQAESAILNPGNSQIMGQHLVCAAAELPLVEGEPLLRIPVTRQAVERLTRSGELLNTASGERWLSPRKQPARRVNLRGGGRRLAVIDGISGEVIGEVDSSRACKECHPGAIYLHRGTSYEITELDFEGQTVVAQICRARHHTLALSEKQTEILEVQSRRSCFGVQLFLGRIRVRERVTGYQKRQNGTLRLLATIPLELPEQVLETTGVWITLPPEMVKAMEVEKRHFMGAIHALEHAMIAMFPLFVLCDRNDIGGISIPLHPQTERASVFVYDGYPGGVGLAAAAFQRMEQLLPRTLQTINDCPCSTGCPSCVHSPKCGSGNRPIDKAAAAALLYKIFSQEFTAMAQMQALPGMEPPPEKQKKRPQGVHVLPEAWGVFDLETIRSADEVGGWNRADRMGVSVGVIYDSRRDECVSYFEDEVEQLIAHLKELQLVVGFNNKRFDNRVLMGYTRENLTQLPSLDLLEEVQAQLGYRLKLDNLGAATLGAGKSADGLQALRWYKEGKLELIEKYCRKDVEITRDLLLHGLKNGWLLFTNKAKLQVRLPLQLDSKIEQIVCS